MSSHNIFNVKIFIEINFRRINFNFIYLYIIIIKYRRYDSFKIKYLIIFFDIIFFLLINLIYFNFFNIYYIKY